jgi:hypothetical protein
MPKGSDLFMLRWAPPPQRLSSGLRPDIFRDGSAPVIFLRQRAVIESTSNTAGCRSQGKSQRGPVKCQSRFLPPLNPPSENSPFAWPPRGKPRGIMAKRPLRGPGSLNRRKERGKPRGMDPLRFKPTSRRFWSTGGTTAVSSVEASCGGHGGILRAFVSRWRVPWWDHGSKMLSSRCWMMSSWIVARNR